MGRRQLTTEFNENVKLEIGQKFEGAFVEKRMVPVDGETRAIYTFAKKDGSQFDVWGAGQLNQYMTKVKPGDYVYVERTADVPSPSFPNTIMKTFIVEVEDK